jgi:drug/metabolite transporter (DMT)-like permease
MRKQLKSKPDPSRSKTRATLAATGSILLWCWSGVCFRKGSEVLGDMVYLTFITGGGALTVFVIQCLRHRPISDLYRIPFRVKLAGFFGVALYTVMLAAAFGMADPGDLGQINLIHYLWPIWMVVLGIVLLKDKPKIIWTLFGALFGFAGVAVSRDLDSFIRAPVVLIPYVLALTGGFLWATYTVLLRKWRIPEEKGGTAFHFAVCAVISAFIAVLKGQWSNMPEWTVVILFWVLFGAIGPVGLGYYWWEIGVKKGAVNLIASLSYFIPIGSSLLIGLIFKESMSLGLLPGAVLITLGAWLVRYSSQDQV